MFRLIRHIVFLAVVVGGGYWWWQAGMPYKDNLLGYFDSALNIPQTSQADLSEYFIEDNKISLVWLTDDEWRIEGRGSVEDPVRIDFLNGEEAEVKIVTRNNDSVLSGEDKEIFGKKVREVEEDDFKKIEMEISDKESVIIDGDKEAVDRVMESIDFTPGVLDWSLLGKSLAETRQVIQVLDSFLAELLPDKDGDVKRIESNLILRLSEQPIVYIGYEMKEKKGVALLDVKGEPGTAPRMVGFYDAELVLVGDFWEVVGGGSSLGVAIVPLVENVFEKTKEGWRLVNNLKLVNN